MFRYLTVIGLSILALLVNGISTASAQRYVFGFHPYFPTYNPNRQYQYRYGPPVFQQTMPQSTPPVIYRPGPRCFRTGSFDRYGNPYVICR